MAVKQLFLLAFLIAQVSCGNNSLTFVIDDTYSMHDNIEHVKNAAKEIVNIVLYEKSSQIEDIVLVTFNDPETVFRKRTRDGQELKQALDAINVHGGGDCPEVALTGIKHALEESQPGSYLFVFTDASAKDYRMFEDIKRLSEDKQSQIVIVTNPGTCPSVSEEANKVYHRIAAASNGQVFRVNKDEVGQVLEYVKETIKGDRTVITSTFVPAYELRNIEFKIDDQTEYTIVSASGAYVSLEIRDQNKRLMNSIAHITWTENVKVVKLSTFTPGTYTARVHGNTEVNIMVFGRTDFNFEHGFSTKVETSLRTTETQPIIDVETHLLVAVKDPKNSAVVQSIELLDMNERVIGTLPLTHIQDNIYATGRFLSPGETFKISVIATSRRTGKIVRRIGKTPVTPIRPVYVAPELSKTEKYIKVKEGASVNVHCRIRKGKPSPQITWYLKQEHENRFELLSGEMDTVLHVTNAQTNDHYKCEARNREGQDEHTLQLDVQARPVFEITPDVITKNEGEPVTIECKLHKGNPRPNGIKWHIKQDNLNYFKILPNGGDILSYSVAQFEHSGTYRCIAENTEGASVKVTKLVIQAKPTIEKSDPYKSAMENTSVILQCRVARGFPKPTIDWFYKNTSLAEYVFIPKHDETLRLDNIQMGNAGNYKCVAKNAVGQADVTVQVEVNAPPRIMSPNTPNYFGVEGDAVMRLPCTAVGHPTPKITWAVNNTIVNSDKSKETYVDGNALVLRDPKVYHSTNVSNLYECRASNEFGKANQTYDVEISAYADFNKSDESTCSIHKQPLVLECPLPYTDPSSVRWYKNAIYHNVTGPTLRFDNPTQSDSNNYTCRVSDMDHAASSTFEVLFGFPPTRDLTSLNIEWEGEEKAIDCRTKQYPEGEYEWYYNGEKIKDVRSASLTLKGWGQYSCNVSNLLGSLVVNFKITTPDKECVIPKSLFKTKHMPLIMDSSSSWPAIRTVGQYFIVPHSDKLNFICQDDTPVNKIKSVGNSFNKFPVQSIYATCDNEETFLVDAVPKNIGELDCKDNVTPSVKPTGNLCLGDNTELMKVGFYVDGFTEVYQSCVDKIKNVPLYTKMNTIPLEWEVPVGIKSPKESCEDDCCYETIQLVNEIDVGLGPAKEATYRDNLNTVNYCKPRNYTNWHEIEKIVRKNIEYTVWSGAVNYFKVGTVWTPKYLWKVMKEVESSEMIAIIHENVPKPGPKLCESECGESFIWFEPQGARTYCCGLDDLKKALGINIDFNEA